MSVTASGDRIWALGLLRTILEVFFGNIGLLRQTESEQQERRVKSGLVDFYAMVMVRFIAILEKANTRFRKYTLVYFGRSITKPILSQQTTMNSVSLLTPRFYEKCDSLEEELVNLYTHKARFSVSHILDSKG